MQRRFLSREQVPVRVEKRDDGTQAIVGYGAVFHREGDDGTEFRLWPGVYERVTAGAFNRALQEGDDVRGLFNHHPDNLLGRTSSGTMSLSVDDVGLRYEIVMDASDPDHQRVSAKIDRGDLTGSSFAFQIEGERSDKERDREVRWIDSVALYDVGPVSCPAYEATTTGLRSDDGAAEVRASYDAWQSGIKERTDSLNAIDQARLRIAELS